MEDRTLVCADCGEAFPFSVAEQEFFREQGFANDPKRCMQCRRARKRSRGAPARTRGPRPEGGGGDGPGGGGQHTVRVRRVRGEGSPQRPAGAARQVTMHDAVCSVCNAETQVPFQPDGVRPVYCLPCLKKTTR